MILCVQHKVVDFDSWKSVFDEHDGSRKEHGAVGYRVLRRGDDSNTVTVLTEFPDHDRARAFVEDPSLGAAMSRAGIEGAPEVTFWEDSELIVY